MIGTRIGHYEIVAKIGEGGMGEVYRARDTKLDRDVALKTLPLEFSQNADRARRFEREAKAVAALSHPNIMAIYDFGVEGDQPFAVMELLEGETLAERLIEGPIPPRKAVDLGIQITSGLAAAHARGIIHRDLKPGNIFITREGRPKILDFGLARTDPPEGDNLSQSPTVQTDPGSVMGTVGYMSPEQVRAGEVDTRSDVFSFGAVLYEMLSGSRAFDGDSAADIVGSVLRDEPKPLREQDPLIPEGLDRIVQHCLEKKPEERFQSARDLGFALANSTSTSQTDLAAVDATPTRHTPARRPWVVAAVLGWLAVAFMLALIPVLKSPEPNPPSRLTNITFSGRDWAPHASPSGDVIVFVSDRDGRQRLWLKQVSGGGEAPLTDGTDDLPRFSPDGSQILFLRDHEGVRTVYRTPVVGGQLRKIIDDVQGADWGPDGSRIVFVRAIPNSEGGNRIVIGIADAQTGAERQIAEVLNRACFGVRWSPDGRYIAYTETGLTGTVATESYVVLVDPQSGVMERRSLTDWDGGYTALEWTPSGRTMVVGQKVEVLATMAGTPGLVMEYDIDAQTSKPLFWADVRVPTGGWGFSTLSVLDENRIVLGQEVVHAELHRVEIQDNVAAQITYGVTTGLGRDRQPAYSPDGAYVIFSSNRSGNVDLWILEVATGAIRQLTDDPAGDWDPAFTPDGKKIIWSSDRGGNMEIWMSDVDGGRAHQITTDGVDAENATMTPDGQWIVYASANDTKLGVWKIRPDGSDAEMLVPGSLILPEVSPDGRYALFGQISNFNTIVQVVEIETGDLTPFSIPLRSISRHGNIVAGRARWTPDGKSIVFIGVKGTGRAGVMMQDFHPDRDTANTRRTIVNLSQFDIESLSISPDGKQLMISALFDRRLVKLADNISLGGWK